MSTTETRLDTFVEAYVTAALWSSTDESDEPLDGNYGPDDLTPAARESMTADCRDFLTANENDLDLYMDRLDYGPEQAGHDFWLTRNRHGAGFWDRYYGEDSELTACLKRLTDAAHAHGESDVYVADDGTLAVS